MINIATLSPSVRLVIFQFLGRNQSVPGRIPQKRASGDAPLKPTVSGEERLSSMPGLNIFPFAAQMSINRDYELVDAWQKPHDKNWNMSFVRFVYCCKQNVNREGLYPEFVAKRKEIEGELINLTCDNLWATQVHLNPYFEKDGSLTGQRVLMIGAAGRKPNVEVYEGGRDNLGQGVGVKVLLSTLASELTLIENEVVLRYPEPTMVQAVLAESVA